jgi:hypothetical protein
MSRPHAPRKITLKLVGTVLGLLVTASGLIGALIKGYEWWTEPVLEYRYVMIADDCLVRFVRSAAKPAEDWKLSSPLIPERLELTKRLNSAFPPGATERTVRSAVFLVVKNLNKRGSTKLVVHAAGQTVEIDHVAQNDTLVLCVRVTPLQGSSEVVPVSVIEFIPERGRAREVRIDPIPSETNWSQANFGNGCTGFGYFPIK